MDAGENARITYSLKRGVDFIIDPTSGLITPGKNAFNSGKDFDIVVVASDHGDPPKSSTDFVIQVIKLIF